MLTILENIRRLNKHYNKKRGSALIMVMMTMAVIIVVGTSMLYITLSSFSTSLAETHQERAYNAALTVSETIKSNIDSVLTAYADDLKDNTGNYALGESVEVKFNSTDSFANASELKNYLTVNGVRVYVTIALTAMDEDDNNLPAEVTVEIIGVYKSQQGLVTYLVDYEDVSRNLTIEDTYGNAFIINNNMGSETKDPGMVFLRIEGDISIDCTEDVHDADGNIVGEKMYTRTLNPLVLEGITGSVYANGDLIIGSADNVLKIQGNIYVDGNLIIRGLDLGEELAAIYKEEYSDNDVTVSSSTNSQTCTTYTHYWALDEEWSNKNLVVNIKECIGDNAVCTDVMYERLYNSDGTFKGYSPMQVYDMISHYTLTDKGYTSFYTKRYTYEKTRSSLVSDWSYTITNTEKIEIQIGEYPNEDYYGAVLYSDPDCTQRIVQFPTGGNIYCSGDIIFDTCNINDVTIFEVATVYNSGIFSSDLWDKNYIERYYYSLAHTDSNGTPTTMPNQSEIGGDIFCYGRMIVDPSYLVYNTAITGTSASIFEAFTTANKYLTSTAISSSSIYTNPSVFASTLLNIYNNTKQANRTLNLSYEPNSTAYGFSKTNLVQYAIGRGWGLAYDSENYGKAIIKEFDPDGTNLYGSASSYGARLQDVINKLTAQGSAYYNEILNEFTVSFTNSSMTAVFGGYLYANMTTGQMPGGSVLRMPKFSGQTDIYINNYTTAEVDGYARKRNYGTAVVSNVITDEGCSVLDSTTVHGFNYTDGLTIKYADYNVSNVYVAGSINVISSELSGYETGGKLTATGGIYCSAANAGEYGTFTLIDIIKKLNPKQAGESVSDYTDRIEVLIEEYWGIKSDGSTQYSNSVDLYLNIYEKYDDGDLVAVIRATTVENWDHHVISPHYRFNKMDYYASLYYDFSDQKFYNQNNDVVDYSSIQSGSYTTNEKTYAAYLNGKTENNSDRLIQSSMPFFVVLDTGRITTSNDYNNESDIQVGRDGRISTLVSVGNYDSTNITLMADDIQNVMNIYNQTGMLALLTTNESTGLGGIKNGSVNVADHYSAYNIYDPMTIVNNYMTAVKPFYESGYGMYLRDTLKRYKDTVNRKDSTGKYIATVSDVMAELVDDSFADVQIGQIEKITSGDVYDKYLKGELTMYTNYSDIRSDASNNPLRELKSALVYDIAGTTSTRGFFDSARPMTAYNFWGTAGTYKIWCYNRVSVLDFSGRAAYFIVYETDNVDNGFGSGSKTMMFNGTKKTSGGEVNTVLRPDYTFSADPLRNKVGFDMTEYDADYYRSQVDYTISSSIYLNFSGLGADTNNDGYSDSALPGSNHYVTYDSNGSQVDGQIAIGADQDRLKARRMYVRVDTTQSDVFIYINAPAPAGTEDEPNFGLIFQKCSFQITGGNNCYIVLVDDTSVSCKAYQLEIVGESEDQTDDYVGTHFYSDKYYPFLTSFRAIAAAPETKWWDIAGKVEAIINAVTQGAQIYAEYLGTELDVGDMFIMGTGNNNLQFGRGGSVNGYVYLPNGTYINKSVGILALVPIASSDMSSATIVAKNIRIVGSNLGKLIFSSFDPGTTGSGSSTTKEIFDFINDTTVPDYKWVFDKYYYD